MSWYGNWRPYVSVAQRQAKGAKFLAKLLKKEGRKPQPVQPAGRKISTSFWGQSWCTNLESYSDYANRLPRGQRYLRNGSVVDLSISKGLVQAYVSGSDVYEVTIKIESIAKPAWKKICGDCSQEIESVLELLQGNLSHAVMQRLTRAKDGMFPSPKEIQMQCSCPDWATMCKHVAATLYGVGTRLDTEPELLFLLRAVDHLDLIQQAVGNANLDRALHGGKRESLAGADLGAIFGIELETASQPAASPVGRSKPRRQKSAASSIPAPVLHGTKTAKKSPKPAIDSPNGADEASAVPQRSKVLARPTMKRARATVRAATGSPSNLPPKSRSKAVLAKKTAADSSLLKPEGKQPLKKPTRRTKPVLVRGK